MPSRPTVDQESSRSRLLRAAKRLFALQGYEQTATSAIAREAGTSESQLMRYFGGKVGLLDALFNDAWAQINERVRKVAQQAPSSRAAILDVLQLIATALARDPDLATLFLFEGRRMRGQEPRIRLPGGLQALCRSRQGSRAQRRKPIASWIRGSTPVRLPRRMMGACEAMIRDRVLARVGGSRAFAEREIKRTLDAMLAGFSSTCAARR